MRLSKLIFPAAMASAVSVGIFLNNDDNHVPDTPASITNIPQQTLSVMTEPTAVAVTQPKPPEQAQQTPPKETHSDIKGFLDAAVASNTIVETFANGLLIGDKDYAAYLKQYAEDNNLRLEFLEAIEELDTLDAFINMNDEVIYSLYFFVGAHILSRYTFNEARLTLAKNAHEFKIFADHVSAKNSKKGAFLISSYQGHLDDIQHSIYTYGYDSTLTPEQNARAISIANLKQIDEKNEIAFNDHHSVFEPMPDFQAREKRLYSKLKYEIFCARQIHENEEIIQYSQSIPECGLQ